MRPDVPQPGRNDSYALRNEARQGTVRLKVVVMVMVVVVVVVVVEEVDVMMVMVMLELVVVVAVVLVIEDRRLLRLERLLH
jgi:hypothetical protein